MSGKRNVKDHVRTTLMQMEKFAWKDVSSKKFTHSFMNGGVAYLETLQDYYTLTESLVLDVMQIEGKVVMCEGFPHIFGRWPDPQAAPTLYPSWQLVKRAFSFARLPIPPILQTKLEPLAGHTQAINGYWDETCFAVDLDYGRVLGSEYSRETLHQHFAIIQNSLRRFGETNELRLDCIVCEAYKGDTLGIHLYFPLTRYYPEECFHIAVDALKHLQETFPNPKFGKRLRNKQSTDYVYKSWTEIFDVSIYSSTLRVPMVQKYDNKLGEFKDRRYWPRYVLAGNGEEREKEWLEPLTDYIQHPPPPECQKNLSELTASDAQLMELFKKAAKKMVLPELKLNDQRCQDVLKVFFVLVSLRKRVVDHHSPFAYPPKYVASRCDRIWAVFFQSIVKRAIELSIAWQTKLQSLACQTITRSDYDALVTANKHLQGLYILQPCLRATTNPLGGDKRPDDHPKESKTKATAAAAAKLELIRSSPMDTNEDLALMAKYSGCRRDMSEDTPADDRYGRCREMQHYLRSSYLHDHYPEIQVTKIVLNDRGDIYTIRVNGDNHYCHFKAKRIHDGKQQGETFHKRSTITFLYSRATRTLYQCCFHALCQQDAQSYSYKGFPLGPISLPDLDLLFSPMENLKDKSIRELLQPTYIDLANQILKEQPKLDKSFRSTRKRGVAVLLPSGSKINNQNSQSRQAEPLLGQGECSDRVCHDNKKEDSLDSFADYGDVDVDPATGLVRQNKNKKQKVCATTTTQEDATQTTKQEWAISDFNY